MLPVQGIERKPAWRGEVQRVVTHQPRCVGPGGTTLLRDHIQLEIQNTRSAWRRGERLRPLGQDDAEQERCGRACGAARSQ